MTLAFYVVLFFSVIGRREKQSKEMEEGKERETKRRTYPDRRKAALRNGRLQDMMLREVWREDEYRSAFPLTHIQRQHGTCQYRCCEKLHKVILNTTIKLHSN